MGVGDVVDSVQELIEGYFFKKFVDKVAKNQCELLAQRWLHLLEQFLAVAVDEQIEGGLCKRGKNTRKVKKSFRTFAY